MICYRDMTFCPYWEGCAKGQKCFRRLTDDVRSAAEDFDLPIYHFMTYPGCFVLDTEKSDE